MKRYSLILNPLLILTLVLVACGDNDESTGEFGDSDGKESGVVEERDAELNGTLKQVPVKELVCDDEIGCVEVAPGDAILLASMLVLSGPDAQLGQDSQRGIEIALDYRPEVLNHPVELQSEDEKCVAAGGQAAARKIVSNPQIVAIIGSSCSGAAVPAIQIISDSGYVMVSPANTAVMLTDPEQAWRPGYLRTAYNDRLQGRVMAEFVYYELGLTKAAAIHDGDPYTEGLATVFANVFEELGGTIVAFEVEDRFATNVESLLTKIGATSSELVYFPTFMSLSALIARTAHEIDGLARTTILASADGSLSQDFLDAAGGSAEGMYHSGPDLNFENQLYEEFLATYLLRYGEEPSAVFHAHAFDAVNMILDAIQEVAIIGTDGALLIGRQALRDALYATANFDGITGKLTCDEVGDCANAKINVNQVVNGEFVRIWP